MKRRLIASSLCMALLPASAGAAPPVVSNVRASQIAGTKNVEILYDVSDADGGPQTIAMQVSGDAGQTYTIPATALSGHIGAGVSTGANKRIVWNAGTDWNGQLVTTAKVRVTASDGTTPAPPPGMAYIPTGTFQMGDSFAEGNQSERPLHMVTVSGFFMEQGEVTGLLYQDVYTWSINHGYNGAGGGVSFGNNKPVAGLQWYNVICWCNARSEKEGLVPVYYNDDAMTQVIRSNGAGLSVNPRIKASANGYRLPTEAEWEKAARGGLLGARYPFGDSISQSDARFQQASPSTVMQFAPNGYNLYDMAGNAKEWCWDVYDANYYGIGTVTDPIGPSASSYSTPRVLRGGAYNDSAYSLRVAVRDNANASSGTTQWGFRCVRKAS